MNSLYNNNKENQTIEKKPVDLFLLYILSMFLNDTETETHLNVYLFSKIIARGEEHKIIDLK